MKIFFFLTDIVLGVFAIIFGFAAVTHIGFSIAAAIVGAFSVTMAITCFWLANEVRSKVAV